MSRISTVFNQLHASGRKALIPYIMAGDPTPQATVELMHTLVAQGADIIELGMPFSDPMADGPVIALAAERALAAGTSTLHVFDMVTQFRQTNQHTPVVLMGYLNPLEIIGYPTFVSKAANAGVDGLLIVDLPAESAAELNQLLEQANLDFIFLIAPTTTATRMQHILDTARGYVYYVSLKGVTGANSSLNTAEVQSKIQHIKSISNLPIGVGFGIHDKATAQATGQYADGIIVGTALVKHFADNSTEHIIPLISQTMHTLRTALDEL